MLPKWLFVAQLFWFALGVVAGIEQQALRAMLVRTRRVWPAAALALCAIGVVEWELLLRSAGSPWRENRITLVDGAYALCVIMTFLAFVDLKLPAAAWLADIGSRSFGIYLAHGVVMDYGARALYHWAPWVLGRQLVLQPIIIGLGLGLPLLAMVVVRRTPLRSVYSYIFG
jgi:membrane-bound acyltransferase YfiQ involved in biofilm formation